MEKKLSNEPIKDGIFRWELELRVELKQVINR